jgi:hypothetical protein
MAIRLVLFRTSGGGLNGEDYLAVMTEDQSMTFADCYVDPGTPAIHAVEDDDVVVIRREDNGELLAEAHRPSSGPWLPQPRT